MSGIFGVFNQGGSPLPPGLLDTMLEPMAHWGPDGQELWKDGHIGLGHLALHSTPESLHEQMPAKSPCGHYVVTANARIDNRRELFGIFDIPSTRRPRIPDSWLILEAYKKWGENCPDHLLGDWAFAIWDGRNQKLFIARDHHGNTGLYYHRSSGRFYFSSSIKGLLALPEVGRTLNEIHLVRRLVSWAEHGPETIYKNIYRLPPAHKMTVSRETVRIQRYWHLEQVAPLRYKSEDDYAEALVEILNEAVCCRLRSVKPVGISLSGGLDSNSVAAFAARELHVKEKRLHAFSSVPFYPVDDKKKKHIFGDETAYIEASIRHIGNIDLTYVRAEDISPLDAIKHALYLHDEPIHSASNQYWLWAIREEARRQGIGVLLTGQGGNATISWHGGGYLAKLAAHLRFFTLWKELRAWTRQRETTLRYEIRTQIVKPLLPLPVKQMFYKYRKGQDEPWLHYSAINPELARRIDLSDLMCRSGHNPAVGPCSDPRQMRHAVIKPGANSLGCRTQQNAAPFGLELRDPTNDKRLLEFCVAIPDDQFFRNGQDRFLIRRAMRDYLPPKVLLNRKRGLQGADIGQRLFKIRNEIKGTLQALERSSLAAEFLDLKKMHAITQQLDQGMNIAAITQAKTILLRGLMVGIFLSNFEGSR